MNIIKNLTSVWNYFKQTDKPIILYGMGDGADKVLTHFNKMNITPYGVMASDDFVRYQKFHQYTVKKLSDFEAELSDFVIALCFASQLPDVMNNIEKIANKHTLLVPSVPVFGEEIFDLAFYNLHKLEIEKAYNLLADKESKIVFENIIKFQYSGNISYLADCTTHKQEVFTNILCLNDNESYLDLGAYRGDTIEEFLTYCPIYNNITAFEPNSKNFQKLKDFTSNLENINLWQLGSYNQNTVINFNDKAGRNSAICQQGKPTQVAKVDTILAGQKITYCKLDVEGAEKETFEGMINTIKLFKPKLNVAAYHRSQDIFALILQLYDINPNYKFYLRHHPYIPHWDTNLYCV